MPLFTAETARIAAIASHAATSARHRPAIQPEPPAPVPQPAPLPADDGFQARRLNRVRDQLDLVDAAIEHEARLKDDAGKTRHPDGQRLNWLAQAQDRLAEQERILAGRPLPGSRRPKDDRTQVYAPSAWIVDAEPVPSLPSSAPSTAPAPSPTAAAAAAAAVSGTAPGQPPA